jgi:hypothetical protein
MQDVRERRHQRLKQGRHLGFGGRIQVQLIKFGEWIHG